MRKYFNLVLAMLVVLLSCGVSLASVGVKVNGTSYGTATDLNFVCGTGTNAVISSDNSMFNINCSPNLATAGVANGGATSMATTDLAIPIAYAFVRKAVAASANPGFTAGTLANGYPGQILTIFASSVGSGGTFVITPTTKTGFASLTLTAAKDEVILLYVNDTIGWVLMNSEGSVTVTLSAS